MSPVKHRILALLVWFDETMPEWCAALLVAALYSWLASLFFAP
jgi:hypothetical protein